MIYQRKNATQDIETSNHWQHMVSLANNTLQPPLLFVCLFVCLFVSDNFKKIYEFLFYFSVRGHQ